MGVITVSAAYGAGGSEIAPRIAQRLGMPFVDRAVPVSVARELGVTAEDAEAISQNAPTGVWAALARMSTLSNGLALPPLDSAGANEVELIERTEQHLRQLADSTGCVVLGHAAAILFADRSDALHVRLDGSPEGRVEAAMRQHGIDRNTALAAQQENDRIRSGYVKHFYRRDATRPDLYHLVLDTVWLSWDDALEIIVDAARLVLAG